MESSSINYQLITKAPLFSAQNVKTGNKVSVPNRSPRVASSIGTKYKFTSDGDDDCDDDDDDEINYDDIIVNNNDDDDNTRKDIENKKISEQRDTRIEHMRSLFATQPKLEKICKDWNNKLVDTDFKEYRFDELTNDYRKNKPNDLKYVVNFYGRNLTNLVINRSCSSSIMPLIKSNCSNLNTLILNFHIIDSKHFENCFSNMPHLEILVIHLKCTTATLPMTLVKSLEQVCKTLKTFTISCEPKKKQLCSPGSSVSVLSPSTETLLSTIEKMENLEKLSIHIKLGVTNEFLINLINNAKKISSLFINGSNITDTGMKALKNAEQLQYFGLDLWETNSENKSITDESLQCLFNKKIIYLNISNCVNITDSAVITLVENLPNIRFLFVRNSQVTSEISQKMAELKILGKVDLIIFNY